MGISLQKFRPTKKGVLSTLGVVVVLAAAAGAGVWLRALQDDNDHAGNQGPVVHGKPLPGAAEKIQELRLAGKDAEADQELNKALQNSSANAEERYLLYIQQGNGLSDKQDYRGAAAAYEQALAVKKTYEITLLLGDTWAAAGDNAKAVQYYKEALPLVPRTPLQDEDTATLKQKITSLGG